MSNASQHSASSREPQPVALDFSTADRDSESYTRTQEAGMVVTPVGLFQFDVSLTDSEGEHRVQMYRASGRVEGRCDCKGFKYGDGPCAHLWSVHRAENQGVVEVARLRQALDGEPTCPTCGGFPPEERP